MTYGFIEIPEEKNIKQTFDAKSTMKLKDKITSAFNKASTSVRNAVQNPSETFKKLGTYINAKNIKSIGSTLSNTVTTISTKYSGIALAQLFVDGKVTSKSAIDYLFLGLAPALNQTGIAMGYSSLQQLKNAMTNGTLNVGEFVGGLSNVVKSINDIAKGNNLQNLINNKNRIYFDMTLSDSFNYQSETPDRRVEDGNDLTEFVHNLPPTIDVQADFEENRRYSKAEFRSLFEKLRDKKVPVTLYLGDEHFESVILQNFNPNGQGSQRSGFEYSLQFKKITVGSVEEIQISSFASAPTLEGDSTTSGGGLKKRVSKSGAGVQLPSGQNGRDAKTKQQEPKSGRSDAKTGFIDGKWGLTFGGFQ